MSSKSFRLVTLGRLMFLGQEGEPTADALRKQRRKLGVLAVLALARERISRDVLIEMFWSGRDDCRARHSLSEALSHLRRVLGPHAITARTSGVELDARAPLTVDAEEFRAAAAAECWERAVCLYDGAFFDGVDTGGSALLEGWIAGERNELELLYQRACERATGMLRAAARWDDAVAIARRWLERDPLSESAALALLGALEAPDTEEATACALQAYDALCEKLAKDYGAAPGERVQTRAALLSEQLDAAGAGNIVASVCVTAH